MTAINDIVAQQIKDAKGDSFLIKKILRKSLRILLALPRHTLAHELAPDDVPRNARVRPQRELLRHAREALEGSQVDLPTQN